MPREKPAEFSDEEVERRAMEMIQRAFTMPHKTRKDFAGKTPRARAAAKRKAAKGSPKSS